MRISEAVKQVNHRTEVTRILSGYGYKRVGDGTDALVFGKADDGPVIKIIIPWNRMFASKGKVKDLISSRKNIFLSWMKFCEENSGNPHLPKFIKLDMKPIIIDSEEFELHGMEKLKKRISDSEHNMALAMSRSIQYNHTFEQCIDEFQEEINNYKSKGNYPGLIKEKQKELAMALKLKNFYDTMTAVIKEGKRLGFRDDIFTSLDKTTNIMKRADNTLVIADPWV
jgi:hypothetical protein